MLLAVVMCTAVVIICLQYSSVIGQSETSFQNQQKVNKRKNLPLGMEGPDQSSSHKALLPRRNLSAIGMPANSALDSDGNRVGRGYAEIQSHRDSIQSGGNRRMPDPIIPNAEPLDNNRLDSNSVNGYALFF